MNSAVRTLHPKKTNKHMSSAAVRPNFERSYLGQFLVLVELFGDIVGPKWVVTFLTPETVVWRYLRCPQRRKQANRGKNSLFRDRAPEL